jgi:hypothetical protein
MAALLPIAAAASDFIDDIHQIPAGDWKYVDVPLHGHPAHISAGYEVLSGSGHVRMALMLREDLQWMDSDPGSILATPEGRRGFFTDPVRRVGDYVIVLDNREGRRPATVRLHVSLDFSGIGSDVGRLSPRRQFTVIALSCVGFLGIVSFSARRLRKAMRL